MLMDEQKELYDSILNESKKDSERIVETVKKIKAKSLSECIKADIKFIKTNNKAYRNYMNAFVVSVVSVITTITLIFLSVSNNISNNSNNKLGELRSIKNAETSVNIKMNNDTSIEYTVKKISLNSNDCALTVNNLAWITEDIETDINKYVVNEKEFNISNKMMLNSMKINNSMAYIEYNNAESTASKEIIFSVNKPKEIDTSKIQKINGRFFESSNPIQIKSYLNSYEKSFLMTVETLAGGKLTDKSLSNKLNSIESTMVKSNKIDKTTVLYFDELNKLDIGLIPELGESHELEYTRQDDVLRVHNNINDVDYIYISSINNDIIGCKPEDLIETTTKGLYIHKDFDRSGYNGYKTFGLKTDNNLYIMKFNSDYYDAIYLNVLKQLGYGVDSIEINKIQNVVPIKTN